MSGKPDPLDTFGSEDAALYEDEDQFGSEEATLVPKRRRKSRENIRGSNGPRHGSNRPGEDRIALDFAEQHAGGFRYIAEWGRWMCWKDDCWRQEKTYRAFDEARALCRIAEDAKAKTVAAVVALARTDRAIAATEDQWDLDGMSFNVPTEEKDQ
jgi:hypothetical protein